MNTETIRILESHSVKPTAMRILVLEQMLQNPREHFSLSELETKLFPADRTTIYRTLQTFVKNGLAHTSEDIEGTAVYASCSEACSSEHHIHAHPHFICESCKRTTCADDFYYSINTQENAANYIVKDIEITIKGICPDCSKKKN